MSNEAEVPSMTIFESESMIESRPRDWTVGQLSIKKSTMTGKLMRRHEEVVPSTTPDCPKITEISNTGLRKDAFYSAS